MYKEQNSLVILKASENSALSIWVHKLSCLKNSEIIIQTYVTGDQEGHKESIDGQDILNWFFLLMIVFFAFLWDLNYLI